MKVVVNILDANAIFFVELLNSLSFVEKVQVLDNKENLLFGDNEVVKNLLPQQSIYEAAAACNATSVDAFFDEVDNRIKNRFLNV